jgi:hypothetical protein
MQQPNWWERDAFPEWTIRADDAERRIARALRICAGNEGRKLYREVGNESLPPRIADLLNRLGH